MNHEGNDIVRFRTSFVEKGIEIMSRIFQYDFNNDYERNIIDMLRNESSIVSYKYYIRAFKLLKRLDKIIKEVGL